MTVLFCTGKQATMALDWYPSLPHKTWLSLAPDPSTAISTRPLRNPLNPIPDWSCCDRWITCVRHPWRAHNSGRQHGLRPLPCRSQGTHTCLRIQQHMQISAALAWCPEAAITKDCWIVLHTPFGNPSRWSARYRRQYTVGTHWPLLAHCSWGKGSIP